MKHWGWKEIGVIALVGFLVYGIATDFRFVRNIRKIKVPGVDIELQYAKDKKVVINTK